MRMCIVGANGQLGRDFMRIGDEGHAMRGIDVPDIDITRREDTVRIIGAMEPEVIINCAAYTAVDACESNRELAFAVNAEGAANLAHAARALGISLVHISTDYVFDGRKGSPYVETDETNPLSVYGASKLAGERMTAEILERLYTFRIAWLYGTQGKNFVATMRRVGREKLQAGAALNVVADQIGTPTYTADVCRQVLAVVKARAYGLYHATSEGACSWYDFARHILQASGIAAQVRPCTTADYPLPAPRPAYSVLENQRLKQRGLNIMPDWKAGFAEFLHDERGSES